MSLTVACAPYVRLLTAVWLKRTMLQERRFPMDFQLARNLSALSRAQQEAAQAPLHIDCQQTVSTVKSLCVKNVNPSASLVHLDRRFQSTSYATRERQPRLRKYKLATTPLRQTKGNLFHPDP